jgi:YidC/Oxa1 family membrane protein insertase
LALRISDNSLTGWGQNNYGQLNKHGTDFKQISAGAYHNLAIRTDGSIEAWGNNDSNQCDDTPDGRDFEAVSAGGQHSLALRSDGSLEGWGSDKYDQATVPPGNDFNDVAAGGYHSLALRSDGSLVGWGASDYGQVGRVPTDKGFRAIAAGRLHNVALRSDGSLAAWGDNRSGQTDVPAGTNFKAVAAGDYHSLALTADGSVVGWGDNSCGQTNAPEGRGFKSIAAGYRHSVALKSDGSMVLWGEGDRLSLASKEIVISGHRPFPLDVLHWKSLDVETANDGSQTAAFEAVIRLEGTGAPVVKLTKTYKVSPGTYLLDCNVTVENLSASEQEVRFNLAGPGGLGKEAFRRDMRMVVAAFRDSDGEIDSPMLLIGKFDGKKTFEEKPFTDKQSIESGKFLWAAATNKYFAAILVPVADGDEECVPYRIKDEIGEYRPGRTGRFYNPDGQKNSGDENVGVYFRIAPHTLTAHGQTGSTRQYNFQLYIGPKDKSLFDKNQRYSDLGFVNTITFMPCFCCPTGIIYPLAFAILATMKWMYGFIGNYGVVIIILVFLMRLLIHPLTKKSQVSMSKMSKLAPKSEEIKKKYANNKAEMNKQMMALYREHGASPIIGFLPMMVQMPIWIALWSAVYASIDLRGASFLPFWITDLSVPDALYRFPMTLTVPLLGWPVESLNLLPILMGVAFYLQQRLMPTQAGASANPQMAQQQKMMKIMLPLLFPLAVYNAPSGVNLYIMASTFAGVFEQHVIRKHIQEKEQAESKGMVAATSKTGGKVKKKKPKPFYKNM